MFVNLRSVEWQFALMLLHNIKISSNAPDKQVKHFQVGFILLNKSTGKLI